MLFSRNPNTGFSLDPLDIGGICRRPPPPQYGGTSAGGQSVNGRLMKRDTDVMGGSNFDRLCHKLKVLPLLLLVTVMLLILL